MNAFLYVDVANGIRSMDAQEAQLRGFVIDTCDDYDDVTYYLKKMGDGHGEVYERVLEVPKEVLPLIHEEYGIDGF